MDDLLEELLEPVLEFLFKLIGKFFKFITKTLIPAAVISIGEAKKKARLKKFRDELDVKAENVAESDENYFDKK